MEFKKDTHGDPYLDVAGGKGNVRITLVKRDRIVRVTGGGSMAAVAFKTDEIPGLIEALSTIHAESIS